MNDQSIPNQNVPIIDPSRTPTPKLEHVQNVVDRQNELLNLSTQRDLKVVEAFELHFLGNLYQVYIQQGWIKFEEPPNEEPPETEPEAQDSQQSTEETEEKPSPSLVDNDGQ